MEAPRNIESLRVSGKKHIVSLKLHYQREIRTRDRQISKQAALTTAPGPRAPQRWTYRPTYILTARSKGGTIILQGGGGGARVYYLFQLGSATR